ncbi:MAG: hypothetical protein E7290_02685 [Lachnospiraceae bacterium]|nr:hypothetical protein [Lachnospiraceae bacterium]
MVGILYSKQTTLEFEQIKTLLSEQKIAVACICADSLQSESLQNITVLINTMGSYYPEGTLNVLVDYFNNGGNIIHLSPTPFTLNPTNQTINHRALRSFEIIDDFHPITETGAYVVDSNGNRKDVSLTGLHGAVYHLCERDSQEKLIRNGYLEHILDAYDEEQQLIATPIIRVVTHTKGSMTFFMFDFHTDLLLDSYWKSLFLTIIQKEFIGNILLETDSALARYTLEEKKPVNITVKPLNLRTDKPLSLSISVLNAEGILCFAEQRNITLPYDDTFTPVLSAPSLYQIVVKVNVDDITLAKQTTGFLVISDDEIADEMAHFKPMYIDESISTDYCLVDGNITAILGTTYFVTDVYRECFYNMNTWLCNQEMTQLAALGFNVLRSGNWTYIAEFYEEDGCISTRGIRALQAYFILAARHGFTVQFALGNVMLNQWDTSRSPIHDKNMRRKCMTYVRSFAMNFCGYPNVTLDIVNEPSYSIKGAWSPGKPSEEPGELTRYREWLQEKYQDISALRNAWGESSSALKSFEDITMPDTVLFSRRLYRTEQRYNYTPVADFFSFARDEFLAWTAEVRANIKKYAPNMTVIMGRDETLRIPAQQDEILAGNIDMVCWHQWHSNADIIYEYLMNKVRGKLCVAQELGMYKYDDVCAGKRHSDEEMADKLIKKLLYSFGNFVQWQAHDDPFMFELSENSLGLYRADMSPTPSVQATKDLITAEKKMQHLMQGRDDNKTKILTVYNTSYYFSVDHPLAQTGIRNHILALYYHMKEQADFLPEHLFYKCNASAIGNPKLIILPGMQTLRQEVWQELLDYVRNGSVVFISGCIDKNPYFGQDAKLSLIDNNYRTRKVRNFEKLVLGDKEYVLDFRALSGYGDISNLLYCGDSLDNRITEYTVGKGSILYCPYPIELSSNTEAVCACYEYAIEKAHAQNEIYRICHANSNIVFAATAYQDCTVYTLINEGFADTVSFTDLRSNQQFTISVDADCGCKLWIDSSGNILETFGKCQ